MLLPIRSKTCKVLRKSSSLIQSISRSVSKTAKTQQLPPPIPSKLFFELWTKTRQNTSPLPIPSTPPAAPHFLASRHTIRSTHHVQSIPSTSTIPTSRQPTSSPIHPQSSQPICTHPSFRFRSQTPSSRNPPFTSTPLGRLLPSHRAIPCPWRRCLPSSSNPRRSHHRSDRPHSYPKPSATAPHHFHRRL